VLSREQIKVERDMTSEPTKKPYLTTFQEAPKCQLQGVDFTVLLPREKSEAMEVLLERYPKGLSFPVHQHKECEQFYLILEGEGEVNTAGKVKRVRYGSVVYIPRNTDHSVSNVGDGDLVYVVFESYPDRYLPEEPTWHSHIQKLWKLYGEKP
jgi:quercetin dioxygenase-like cupin family protein